MLLEDFNIVVFMAFLVVDAGVGAMVLVEAVIVVVVVVEVVVVGVVVVVVVVDVVADFECVAAKVVDVGGVDEVLTIVVDTDAAVEIVLAVSETECETAVDDPLANDVRIVDRDIVD